MTLLCGIVTIIILRKRIGDFHQFFFLFNLPVDICDRLWYNRGEDWRAANASQGPFSRTVPHMQIFQDF